MPNGFALASGDADFVFRGTIQELGAATLASLQPTGATAIVAVAEVFHAPEAFTGLAGETVTVRLRDAGHVAVGEVADFAADGWLVGESLALVEREHRPPQDGPETLADEVMSVRQDQSGAELRDRFVAADLVVAGRVAEVRPLTGARLALADSVERRSEHEPQAMEAVLDVSEVIKGSPPGDEVVVVFPASEDVAYVYTPKFETGQEGVFLLHSPDAVPRLAAAATEAFTAPTMLDVQLATSSADLRAIVEE
ncbi:hypothetical protein GCM10010168_73050 [Actinoplanes ianthinogenes]|uniref:Uncharacterized protein n=1 Tax=Actinoplanes ianthinogenes TaxID=122358 RepID=A0ABM7LN61_9ACTN|nr:hypothetical protein [Actinoplanes ianthinogenes]BCJ40707.1 hypothetical protein Aiant_13640 [Actinoplanes ianthinogenes]GGR43479.1 hypothetical protein GCM10010168_73050 [Actinoplanes ianthinogenes]